MSRSSDTGDPRLKTYEWALIRRYWQRERDPVCRRCWGRRGPIDYTSPRFTAGPDGRRRENPLALDVGHIVSREHDDRQVWEIGDTQPEHVVCNREAGARSRAASRAPDAVGTLTVTTSRW